MRECPKCGELNGENNSRCYKCNAFIGKVETGKKICRVCGTVYNGNKSTCDTCGGSLSTYDPSAALAESYRSESHTWMYICTIIIPLIGIILGCVKSSGAKTADLGKRLIILGVILTIVYPVVIFVINYYALK